MVKNCRVLNSTWYEGDTKISQGEVWRTLQRVQREKGRRNKQMEWMSSMMRTTGPLQEFMREYWKMGDA